MTDSDPDEEEKEVDSNGNPDHQAFTACRRRQLGLSRDGVQQQTTVGETKLRRTAPPNRRENATRGESSRAVPLSGSERTQKISKEPLA
jgi:hypothetical protein